MVPRTPPPDGVALRRPATAIGDGLRIRWEKDFLTIRGDDLPGQEMRVHYLEAYCRPGSTDRDWGQTVIGHTTELVSASDDGKVIKLRCTLKDGVVVDHVITAGRDEVDFRLTARNPTDSSPPRSSRTRSCSRASWSACTRTFAWEGSSPAKPNGCGARFTSFRTTCPHS